MNRRNDQQLRSAIVDAAGLGVSFFIGIDPARTSKVLWRLFNAGAQLRRRQEKRWLDWVLKDWAQLYADDAQQFTTLNLDGAHRPLMRIPYAVEVDNTLDRLDSSAFSVARAGRFVPDASITSPREAVIDHHRALRRRLTKKKIFDGTCARLTSYDADSRTFTLGTVGYFDSLKTNLAMDFRDGTGTTLRQQLHEEGLEPVGNSHLADPLGINILLISGDGYLVVSQRSNTSIVRPGQMCPSTSGTVLPNDLGGDAFDSLNVLREVGEELGGPVETATSGVSFLGMARDFVRGGLPDLFFVATCSLGKDAIKESWRHAKDRSESDDVHFFQLAPYHGETSTPSSLRAQASFELVLAQAIDGMEKIAPLTSTLLTNIALWNSWRRASLG